MGELHHHACPRCHELPVCLADCTVEPDLGTTPGGYPKAHPVVCVRCEREALTPSEVALSKVLAAWVEWWVAAPSCGPDGDCMSDVGLSLIKRGMVNRNGTTSPAGAALLDRARKAGVL